MAARRGFTIATTSLLPNVVMAFVIIQALKVTGLLDIVGRVCEAHHGSVRDFRVQRQRFFWPR